MTRPRGPRFSRLMSMSISVLSVTGAGIGRGGGGRKPSLSPRRMMISSSSLRRLVDGARSVSARRTVKSSLSYSLGRPDLTDRASFSVRRISISISVSSTSRGLLELRTDRASSSLLLISISISSLSTSRGRCRLLKSGSLLLGALLLSSRIITSSLSTSRLRGGEPRADRAYDLVSKSSSRWSAPPSRRGCLGGYRSMIRCGSSPVQKGLSRRRA